MKKLTREEFIERCSKVHGNRYDYSRTIYINRRTAIDIRCKKHGIFRQLAGDHIYGHGCPLCKAEAQKKMVLGVGINDINCAKRTIAWRKWMSMLTRCYGVDNFGDRPTYKECTVCDEWLVFSNFKAWFDKNYRNGYCLDKDILFRGNKIYSPDTCSFVPHKINTLILDRGSDRGVYPVGVGKQGNKFQVGMNIDGKRKYIGLYNTVEEAFDAYKQAKECHIKEVATEYYNDGKISKQVYEALMRWEVRITD